MFTEIAYEPLETFRRLQHLRHLTFLDSARPHPLHGRYSFLAADPRLIIRSEGGSTKLSTASRAVSTSDVPWEVLDQMLSRFRVFGPSSETRLPIGAAIGFLGYEMGGLLERLPPPRPALLSTPDMWFGFYDVVIAFDHAEARGWLISSGLDEGGVRSSAQAEFRRDQFLDELQSDVAIFPAPTSQTQNLHAVRSREEHEGAIKRALRYIHAGDVYQVNLSHPFVGSVTEAPQDLYLRLRKSNPAPFGAYLDFGGGQLLSSSPERFLSMNRRVVQARPVKGTCPRVGDPVIDWKSAEALLHSAKNRAELLMITDLLRNDLGKIADYGSVEVTDLMRLEEYETVYHLVSTVEARLQPNILHLDAVAACFPGGSITGAPKLRAMEIIHELEPCARGIYTGSLGYIGFNGVSDFNILIRSMVHQQGQTCFHLGGGIVADSDPSEEYEETLHKGRALMALWTKPGEQVETAHQAQASI